MSYESDRAWSDKFIWTMKQIIAPYLLVESSDLQDKTEASDLVVLKAKGITIACRVRRFGFADKYPNQFTIRKRRDSGAETEALKIWRGWADWMFYGHSTQEESWIDPWWLIDLQEFRRVMRDATLRAQVKMGEQANGDGTHFQWFDITSYPHNILIANSK